MEIRDFNKLKVLITGGNKGIGLEISKLFVENEIFVTSLSRTKNLSINSDKYRQIECDLSNQQNILNFVNESNARNISFDIIINNAGIIEFGQFHKMELQPKLNMINTNLIAPITLLTGFLPKMIENRFGIIVNISSIGAISNFANCAVYNSSKAAILSLSKSLRNEVRKDGIKIIDIIPGATFTDIWYEDFKNKNKDRMINPYYIAKLIYDSIKMSIDGNLMTEEIIITPQGGSL